MKRTHFKLLLLLMIASVSLYSQEESNYSETQNFKLRVSLDYSLDESDVSLLRQELKTSKNIESLVKIDLPKGNIYFETKSKDPNLYTPIFNKYFSKYDVYEYSDIIYSVDNTKIFPEHYPSKIHLDDPEKQELLFQENLDSWKRNYPGEWEEYQKELSNDLK